MEQNKKQIVGPEDVIKSFPDGSAKVLMYNILTINKVINPMVILLKAERRSLSPESPSGCC